MSILVFIKFIAFIEHKKTLLPNENMACTTGAFGNTQVGFLARAHSRDTRGEENKNGPKLKTYLSNTPTNLCMALLNFVLFCFVLYCYAFVQYCYLKSIQCNAMHKFVGVLDNSRRSNSSIKQKHHKAQVHRLHFWICEPCPRKRWIRMRNN